MEDLTVKGHLNISDFHSAAEYSGLKISQSVWRKAFKEMDQKKKSFIELNDLTNLLNGNICKLTH